MRNLEWENDKLTPKMELMKNFIQFSKIPGPQKELFPIKNAFEIMNFAKILL